MLPEPLAPAVRRRERTRLQPRVLRFLDIGFLTAAAVLLIIVTGIQGYHPEKLILGLSVGGFGSGYAVTAAVFSSQPLKPEERFALSLLFSIAVIVVATLIMTEVDVKITSRSLAMVLGVTVFAANAVSVPRRWVTDARSTWSANIGLTAAAALGLAVVLGLAAWFIVGSYLTYRAPEFFVTKPGDLQTTYPSQIDQGARFTVRLNIRSFSSRRYPYLLIIKDNGRVESRARITVDGRWSNPYVLPAHALGNQRVEFMLYRNNPTQHPFRALWLYYTVIGRPGPNPS